MTSINFENAVSNIGLANDFVETIMKNLDPLFCGVFPADMLENVRLKNGDSLIVNLSPHTDPGSHFIAFKVKNNKLYLFDSLKLFSLYNQSIKKFINDQEYVVIKNKYKIQSNESLFCGFYVIGFLLSSNFLSMNEFNNFFDLTYLKKNDTKIQRVVKKLIYMIQSLKQL